MKAGLITQLYPTVGDLRYYRRLTLPLQWLGISQYNRRPWHLRLPAVIIASLLINILLLGAGISLDGSPLLALVPLVCAPLVAAVALSSA